jgi:hypothetical protein
MQWQPIATAPKDGTEIVLWCEDGSLVRLACWRGGAWREWDLARSGFDCMAWVILQSPPPTHWFKIEPPTTEGGAS